MKAGSIKLKEGEVKKLFPPERETEVRDIVYPYDCKVCRKI
jgi:hypothetical protein